MLDVDTLLPGAVYDVVVDYIHPAPNAKLGKGLSPNAKKSSVSAPKDSTGMGISMTAIDFTGRTGKKIQLEERPDSNGRKVFRIVVPENAVKLLLDFHNDDLVRFNHNQIETQARRWGTIRIYQRNLGEIAADNAYWQYIYRKKPAELKVRNYVSPGKFELDVLRAKLRKRPESSLKVAKRNGGMCLIFNGKAVPPMLMSGIEGTSQYKIFDEAAKYGMNVLICRYPYGGPVMHGDWQGKGKYDFSDLDKYIYGVLIQNPDAGIILSIDQVYAPDWWTISNKDSLARTQDGDYVRCLSINLYKRAFGSFDTLEKIRKRAQSGNSIYKIRGAKSVGFYVPSIASEKYAEIMREYLTDLRKYIESRPYGKAVVGYRFVWGYDGQWGPLRNEHGYGKEPPKYIDYSEPMQKYFRKWLKNKYGTVEKLRKAWNSPNLTFKDAAISGIENRNIDQFKNNIYLLNPEKYQNIIDYREATASVTSELLLKFCKAVKDAGKKDIITMAYYPDVSGRAGGGPNSQTNYRMVLDSKYFDAAGGPSYEARDIGLGNNTNALVSSFPLHSKLHLTEMDHRVFPVARRNYANNLLFDTPRRSLSILRREYMKQMCFGAGSWTFDMGLGWFNDPLIAAIIGDSRKVFSNVLEYDRSTVAKMAVFIGNYSKMVQADSRRGSIPKTMIAGNTAALYHTGTPVDYYNMCDLELVKDKYKVFYFPVAYGLRPEEVKAIDSLKKDGNVLVFGCGAGYVTDTASMQNVEKLTGMTMKADPALSLTVKIVKNAHSITKNINGYFGSGGERGLELGLPKFYVDDPKAVKLGEFVKSNGKCGFAVKDFGSWKSVYIGSTGFMNGNIFKNIARYAGLHIYNEDSDVMFFNKSLIAIHASSSGTKTIVLPEKADVTSLWDNKYAGKLQKIERDMKAGENALYLVKY
jgi:beta-galactosidase